MERLLLRSPGVASTSRCCSRVTLASTLPGYSSVSATSKEAIRCCRRLGGKSPLTCFAATRASASSASASDEPPPPSSSFSSDLPIAQVIPECLRALDRGHLVLEAPPGAGKTTALPLEILAADPPWLQGKALVVVEPRRLAATAAARRMVSLLQKGGDDEEGEEKKLRVGRKGCPIGYAVRGDARCSFRDARVVVVTPGVATRLLMEEFEFSEKEEDGGEGETTYFPPVRTRRRRRLFASGIGAVMLDEAHERSAEVDLLFALLAARTKRPEGLKVVFASATLGGGLAEKAAARLGGESGGGESGSAVASIVRAPAAKSCPVAVRFAGPPRDTGGRGAGAGAAALAAAAAAEAVALLNGAGGRHTKGDVLVFLPGGAAIRATRAALEGLVDVGGGGGGEGVEVLQLHGGLPPAEQDRVLAPLSDRGGRETAPRRRRIILSTPVVESSLTVPGVTSVVDSGLSRVPRLDPNKGVEKLITLPISKSSADQRAGRAGREAPGACVRLWSEGEHSRRPAAAAAEVSRGGSDLAPLALALVAADNYSSTSPLPWLDEPHRGDLSAGLDLLDLLGLIFRKKERDKVDENTAFSSSPHRAFELSQAGKQASSLGAHPRLSRMLLCAARLGCPELGAVLSSVCSERDFILRNNRGRLPREGGAGVLSSPAPAPGASAVERVLALAGRGPLASSVDRRAAAGILDAAMVLERQLRGVAVSVNDSEEQEEGEGREEEEDEEGPVVDDDGDGDGETSSQEEPPRLPLRRAERRLALAHAAADAVEKNNKSLVGFLIASAYPDRVAARRSRGGRDRSAAFVLGGNETETSAPATAVLQAGSQDPLMAFPFLAVATLGTSAAAARSSSLIFLAAPLEPKREGEKGVESAESAEIAEILRAIPGLLASGERLCAWVPSAARLVCSVRTRIGRAVVEERALDALSEEVTDEEAGSAFAEAARRGGGLAALREPRESREWRKRVVANIAKGGEVKFDGSLLSDLGGEAASPRVLEALLPALCKCRTAADLESIDWVPLLSAALLSPEQAEIVGEEEASSDPSSSSSIPRAGGGRDARGSSPAVMKAGKKKEKKGRPKR